MAFYVYISMATVKFGVSLGFDDELVWSCYILLQFN